MTDPNVTQKAKTLACFVEILLLICELTVGNHLCTHLSAYLTPKPRNGEPMIIAKCAMYSIFQVLLIFILTYSMAWNFCTRPSVIFNKMGLSRSTCKVSWKMIAIVTSCHIVSTYLLDYLQNHYFLSAMKVVQLDAKRLSDPYAVIRIIVFAPLIEEIVCRGFIFLILIKYVSNSNRFRLIVISSFIFALIHLSNLFQSANTVSDEYLVLQIVYGFIVSIFYGTRMMCNDLCIVECIILHVFNNLISLFAMPPFRSVDVWQNPIAVFGAIQSIFSKVLQFLILVKIEFKNLIVFFKMYEYFF
ncbi:hypothetical protein RFI_08195 [Reticulomyxa filosa]|uniref:CAAX prenyl protease 2/Lysostaphin resistance protein A-like domain-containing protein n=1 Tax=Reticulomyxa filosa TaxID=46433 RepID=X6NSH2_RETFI|nr:hypothetical protein RFI_08195 [Reticulomyxa filosa]|eukprot:ETO28931.1 hypothetical protein RFI_08195 [Reticulomyxa filosa]